MPATIFVARDAGGESRYIGDVARGAACGCFCFVCGGELVAKQGEELEWHFAHASGSELPQCLVGARNLIRRLIAEELAASSSWKPQPYRTAHPIAGYPPIEWTAAVTGSLMLAEAEGAEEPAAYMSIEGGLTATVYVAVGKEALPTAAGDVPVAFAWCPDPEGQGLRSEADTRKFVRESMQSGWLHLPDIHGRLQDAVAQAKALRDERALEAGRRWASTRRTMLSQAEPHVGGNAGHNALPNAGPERVERRGDAAPAWAPGLRAKATFQYRELDDGSAWVLYPSDGSEWRLAPVPLREEGWDEYFPPAIASPTGYEWLRVESIDRLYMLFNAHVKLSRITSSIEEVEQLMRMREMRRGT